MHIKAGMMLKEIVINAYSSDSSYICVLLKCGLWAAGKQLPVLETRFP